MGGVSAEVRCRPALGLVLSGVLLAGCTEGTPSPKDTGWRTVSSARVPWSFAVPPSWHVSTLRSVPIPDAMTGVLRTYGADRAYAFDFGSPGPNSNAKASGKLGESAVVVFVELGWYPADQPIAWRPKEGFRTVQDWLSGWHADAQNPGWVFRERKLCLGSECVHVLEWHGPEARGDDILRAQDIASSVVLKDRWTDLGARE